jgi:serine/threonine protein kinase
VQTRIFILAGQLSAVEELHKRGFVHLDIKPDNILVDDAGHLTIADFGLAVKPDRENYRLLERCGTAGYQAPEVLRKQFYGAEAFSTKADIWSLGIVILQLMTDNEHSPYWSKTVEFLQDLKINVKNLDEDRLSHCIDLQILWTNPQELPEMIYLRNRDPCLHNLLSKVSTGTCDLCNECHTKTDDQMLVFDPEKRWPAAELKRHSFFYLYKEEYKDTRRTFYSSYYSRIAVS